MVEVDCNNLYLNSTESMSHKFSSTAGSFNNSSLIRQEELIRQIVQSEFLVLFDDIKVQIETKIKSIDKNISQIKKDISKLERQNKVQNNIGEVIEKLDKIQAEMQILRYHQQFELKTSRAKSFDKERKPIFRRTSGEHEDFSSLILGLQGQESQKKQGKKSSKKKQWSMPPLCGQLNSEKSNISNRSPKRDERPKQQQSIVKKHVILQDSKNLHKWLAESNKSGFSCLDQIIKEQDIEESVFY